MNIPQIIAGEIDGQPLDKDADRLLHLRQPHPGMAKQRQLNGKAQLIGSAAAGCHEILVGPGEAVMPRQPIRFLWDAKKPPAFFVGEQRSARHDASSLVLEMSVIGCGHRRFSGRILWTEGGGRYLVDFQYKDCIREKFWLEVGLKLDEIMNGSDAFIGKRLIRVHLYNLIEASRPPDCDQ